MKELFGIPINSIMVALIVLFAIALLTVVVIGLANPTMFRLGVRNLPRRGAQTILIVAGLTLSTLIITAAFVTGDTVNYSFDKSTEDLLQRADLDIGINGDNLIFDEGGAGSLGEQNYVSESAVPALEQRFAGDADIAGFMPFLYQQAPVRNVSNGLAKPIVQFAGFDPVRQAQLGGYTLADGGEIDLATLGPNDVLVSEKAAGQLKAKQGDTLAVYINDQPHEVHVAGIVKDELASGVMGVSFSRVPSGIAIPLATLQDLTGRPEQVSAIRVALTGGGDFSEAQSSAASTSLESFINENPAQLFGQPSAASTHVEVNELRKDSLDEAALESSLFTTFFLVLGLFSMAAGIMLIFMIFVMLAAERRAEMGMARAVGAQRHHLVQSFIAEGMAYSLLAGIVGVGLGVVCSLGMTVGLLKVTGGDSFSLLHAHVSLQSMIIGYTLGVAVTFLTVVFASLKASHVNIVAAIRSLPDDRRREARRKTHWGWVVVGLPLFIVPPLGIWLTLRKGVGLPWPLIIGPVGILTGAVCMLFGESTNLLFPFALGISLIPLSIAALARYFGAPNRLTWTIVGILLGAYWLMPTNVHDALFGEFDSNIEMFVLSGIMIVASFSLVIVFNARLLTALFVPGGGRRAYALPAALAVLAAIFAVAGVLAGSSADGLGQLSYLLAGLIALAAFVSFASARFPQLGPALKMSVAYPLSNRFRTGMTIAMFSIIVFSLTVFSVLLSNFNNLGGGTAARGNIDIVASTGQANPVPDLQAALGQANSPVASDIETVGRVTIGTGSQQVRQPGKEDWINYPIVAADNTFLGASQPALEARAEGYASDQAVLDAVRTQPGLALLDPLAFTTQNGNDFELSGVDVKDDEFKPFQLELRDEATGQFTTVTVIGELKSKLSAGKFAGVYLSEPTYTAAFGAPEYHRMFLRLVPDANARDVATGIESALGTQGVAADSVQKLLADDAAENQTFQRMFQAFMTLGLIVGIAGLGVIAFRSVVERRQQIGMLRAIGYQRGTIALTFLLESSFVAVMGILSGVVGGAIIARNLLTSDSFTDGQQIAFSIPWVEVTTLVFSAYIFSLLMTWWPSRGASRVPVADALRYE